MSEPNNDLENLQEWGLERFLIPEELDSYSWEERMEYEDKLKRYRDWHNVIDTAKREVGLKIAKKAKTAGIPIDIIQKSTDLSKEEIEKL